MKTAGMDFEIQGVRMTAENGHDKASREIKEFIARPLFDEKVILSKSSSWPKISIVTPSYNQAEFLERTILSVLNQNYPNMEYMVIDGGSTDGSLDIIKKYGKYLAYWVSEPDNGQEDAINKGFKRATGDIIAWQNSDDIYLPGAFSNICEAYRKHPDSDVVFGNMYLINENDVVLKDMRFVPFDLEHLVYYDWNLSSQAVFWKRGLFDRTGYLKDYGVSFDLDWFIRLGRTTDNFRFIKKFLGGYRIHSKTKLSLVKDDIRWPLFVKIMKENDLKIDENLGWDRQYRFKKLKAFVRKFFLYVLQGDIDYIFKGVCRRVAFKK